MKSIKCLECGSDEVGKYIGIHGLTYICIRCEWAMPKYNYDDAIREALEEALEES